MKRVGLFFLGVFLLCSLTEVALAARKKRGKFELNSSQLFAIEVGGKLYNCGQVKNRWIPGVVRGRYFIPLKFQLKQTKVKLKTTGAAKYSKAIKKLRTKIKAGKRACVVNNPEPAPTSPGENQNPTPTPTPSATPTLSNVGILSSNPSSGSIDARRPSAAAIGSQAEGISRLDLTFNSALQTITTTDFSITQYGGSASAPTITAINALGGNSYRLLFDKPISPGAWTKITYLPSNTRVCLGFLPGDVNRSREVINGQNIAGSDTDYWLSLYTNSIHIELQMDINRDGAYTISDYVTLVDMNAGIGAYSPGNDGTTLPFGRCQGRYINDISDAIY